MELACDECGMEIAEGDAFCGECGARVVGEPQLAEEVALEPPLEPVAVNPPPIQMQPEPSRAAQIACPNCGRGISPGESFCPWCGVAFQGRDPQVQTSEGSWKVERGFFASLFDLSFSSFVTPKLIKILFILLLVVLGLIYLAVGITLASNAEEDATPALVWFFVLGPLTVFIYLLIFRVVLEVVLVLFRIYESSRDQVALLRAAFPEAAASVPETGIVGPRRAAAPAPPRATGAPPSGMA